MSNNEILFRFKTVQTNAIRILFESLKNILSDVNFKADLTGLKLTTIDGTQSAIVNLHLMNDKFEEYICERPVNIGINLLSVCLLYTSPSPRDRQKSRMPSSA